MSENRAKNFFTDQKQISEDGEIFEAAKFDVKKIDKVTQTKIVEGVIDFAEKLADETLYPYQREFAERIVWSLILADGETIAGEFSRQSGKSFTLSALSPATAIMLPLFAEYLWKTPEGMEFDRKSSFVFKKWLKGFWTGIYGPDYDRAAIIGNKVNSALQTPNSKMILSAPGFDMTFPEKLAKYTGRLPRGSYINVKSANKRVSIEGDTYHLVITDETQEISDYVLKKSISPMLAATLGTTVHIGSAYPQRVYFYDIIKQQKEADIDKPKHLKNYYGASYKIAQKYNPNYAKYIAKEKKKLGENSDEFRMSYELYWPIEKGMFITEDFLMSRIAQDYYVTNYDKTNDHVIAIDVAKIHDNTIVTVGEVDWDDPIVVDEDSGIIRHHKKIKNWLELGGDDYDEQYYQICNFVDHFRWNKMIVDATGVGSPMFDRLKNKYSREGKLVVPFVYSKESKSEGYSLFLKELLAERWEFPASESTQRMRKFQRFKDQMINLAKEFQGGYLSVHHSSETGLDDYADSWMMLNMAIEESVSMEVAEETIENIYRASRVGESRKFLGQNRVRKDSNFWRN